MRFMRLMAIGVVLLLLAGAILGTACAGAKGEQGPKGDTGADGVGIQNVVDNGDGTLTINLTNGGSYTTDNLTGPQGEKGDTGLPGAGIAWQGEWSNSLTYRKHDAVGWLGSSYVSKQDNNANHIPTDTGWWDLWVTKGDRGEAGVQGLQGDAGPNMIVAVGNIQSSGTIQQGYNVTSATWDAVQLRYEITLTGINYASFNYVTLVTLLSGGSGRTAETNYASGQLVVYIYDSVGNTVQGYFNFVVLDPDLA